MKNMYKAGFLGLILAFALNGSVLAQTDHNFEGVVEIIEKKVSCSELTDDQLEKMGDYYMEQMHPGENHNLMDEMMGGEGSESLRQAHIFMARRWYCGDATGMGMMGMMMGSGYGMNSFSDIGMMSGYNNFVYGKSGLSLGGYWLTKLLVWSLLVLGIASGVKYLRKK